MPPTSTHTSPTISPLNKGLGFLLSPTAASDIPALGWNLLRGDLSLPTAVLHRDKLLANRDWMQRFIAAYGLKLAPHGKTTMAPQLFHLQLDGGAWGITLATAQQTTAAYVHGIRRVLLANQLVGRANMAAISRLLEDPTFDFFCLVDSPELADDLAAFFAPRHQRLQVLLELGVPGGRAGLRDHTALDRTLVALDRHHTTLPLCGLEIYEGVLKDEPSIRAFLQHAVATATRLARAGRFDRSPILLSGAGSAWYDVVAEEFSRADLGAPTDVILRPGCYLTHDVGIYRAAQARIDASNPVAREMATSLQPALELWAAVQSRPEPNLAIIALGKRDAAFDSGLPTPTLHLRPGRDTHPIPTPAHWQLTRMMDQHAYLTVAPQDDLRVGDLLGLSISHPCLTFDKWRYLPVLDSTYTVVDLVETFF